MTTIKSYTDLEQSKKLAEILPLESADMVLLHEEPYETSDSKFDGLHQTLCVPFNKYDKSWRQKYKNISYFPCWSLAALLEEIPEIINFDDDESNYALEILKESDLYYLSYGNPLEGDKLNIEPQENFVDTCVAMIEKLHELNLL